MSLRAVGLLAVMLAPFAGAARGGEPVEITLARHPGSPWILEVSLEDAAIEARQVGHPGMVLEIDCDDEADDGRHPGIVAVFGERRLEGRFWGSLAPFFYPILVPGEHVLEKVRIEPGPEGLRVRFEGGSYSLLQPAAGDESLFAEFVFAVRDGELNVHMDGLYYLLPSQRGTHLRISSAAGEAMRRIDRPEEPPVTVVRSATAELARLEPSGGQHREYFETVDRLEIRSPEFGEIVIETWIERLQIQVDRNPHADSDLFELDFDHTFKDRGQRSVMGLLMMEIPVVPPPSQP